MNSKTEIWLTDKYYCEFQERKGVLFSDEEAVDVYKQTQLLYERWPGCIGNPPPEIGSKFGLFYIKNDWPACTLRICFGAHTVQGIPQVVALTCRTKQELSKGNSGGTSEWYRHMATVGVDRWDDFQRGYLVGWKIYP